MKPSRYHLSRDRSRDQSPRCWIPRLPTRFQSPGPSPRCQTRARTRAPTRRSGTPGESRSPRLPRGFSPTAPTRCQTARSPRASSCGPAGRCRSLPLRTAACGPSGGCRPRCRTCSGCHPSRSLRRPVSWTVAHPLLSHCCCCCAWGVCGRWGVRASLAGNAALQHKGTVCSVAWPGQWLHRCWVMTAVLCATL